jgi:hypothetical protein
MKANLREIIMTEKVRIIMAMETITRACGNTTSITGKAQRIPSV